MKFIKGGTWKWKRCIGIRCERESSIIIFSFSLPSKLLCSSQWERNTFSLFRPQTYHKMVAVDLFSWYLRQKLLCVKTFPWYVLNHCPPWCRATPRFKTKGLLAVHRVILGPCWAKSCVRQKASRRLRNSGTLLEVQGRLPPNPPTLALCPEGDWDSCCSRQFTPLLWCTDPGS